MTDLNVDYFDILYISFGRKRKSVMMFFLSICELGYRFVSDISLPGGKKCPTSDLDII